MNFTLCKNISEYTQRNKTVTNPLRLIKGEVVVRSEGWLNDIIKSGR